MRVLPIWCRRVLELRRRGREFCSLVYVMEMWVVSLCYAILLFVCLFSCRWNADLFVWVELDAPTRHQGINGVPSHRRT